MKKHKSFLPSASRCVILFLILLAGNTLSAQTEKGNLMVGGNIYWNLGPWYPYPRVYHYTPGLRINPNVGYFIINNVAIGTGVPFYVDRYGFGMGLTPFVRGYIPNLGSDKLRPFAMVVVGINGYDFWPYDFPAFRGSFSFVPGVSWFLNRNVALEGMLWISNDVKLTAGVQIYLPTKK